MPEKGMLLILTQLKQAGKNEVTQGMEPNRYWLLYFGLLFIFLGIKVGQAFCLWAFNIFRACFYTVLALAAAALAKLLWKVSFLLLKFANAHMTKQENHTSARAGETTASASRESD